MAGSHSLLRMTPAIPSILSVNGGSSSIKFALYQGGDAPERVFQGRIERIGQLLDDPEILSDDVRAVAFRNRFRGVGCCEAPRGTLFHDYQVERGGTLTRVNLLIATGQNNLAMNRTVAQIARHFLTGKTIEEGLLNRVEAGIRAFDPCLSCATHALGKMPLQVELLDAEGGRVGVLMRNTEGTLYDSAT